MDKAKREELVDLLLVELNDEVDSSGRPAKVVFFSFDENVDRALLDRLGVDFEGLTKILDFCIAREYLRRRAMGGGYSHLSLTEEGVGRAISVDAASRHPSASPVSSGDIHIGTLNTNGATQIGHQNTQSIVAVLDELKAVIDNSDAPEEEKAEAKSLLQRFVEHPLVASLVGAAAGAAING